jgi:hypothetical protein
MIDENTPLAGPQLFSEYGATAEQDAESREEAPPIDRVFISIALLGTQVHPCLEMLPRIISLTTSHR